MTKAQLMTKEQHHWDIWIADDGVLGTSFAHGWLEPTDTLIVYDAPDTFDAQLRDSDGNIIASGDDLARSMDSPMTRLRIRGKKIVRDEIWPQEAVGAGYQVLLQGGQVGTLKKWSSDDDRQEWHLDIEFSYHRSVSWVRASMAALLRPLRLVSEMEQNRERSATSRKCSAYNKAASVDRANATRWREISMDTQTNVQQEESAQMITVGCQRLRVAIRRGDGIRTPLFLMPGIGSGLEIFEPFVDELDPTIEVIRFDIPGTGGSPTPVSPYSIVSLTFLVDKMLDQLGYRQVDVFGFSWGGSLAQQFALQFPQRCRRLILSSTGTGVTMVPGRLPAILQLLTPWNAGGEPFFLKELIPTREASPEVTRAFMRAISPLNQRGYIYQLVAAISWTSLPWLWSLRQPTLILAGDDDPIVPVTNAKILHAGIFHSQLYVYHGGHMGVLTNAKEFARVIERFLLP